MGDEHAKLADDRGGSIHLRGGNVCDGQADRGCVCQWGGERAVQLWLMLAKVRGRQDFAVHMAGHIELRSPVRAFMCKLGLLCRVFLQLLVDLALSNTVTYDDQ